MADAKHGNLIWHVPMSELARITTKPSFPIDYAEDIQCEIIKRFTSYLCHYPTIDTSEIDAVWKCFHSLRKSGSITATKVCDSFIICLISHLIYRRNDLYDNLFSYFHPEGQYVLFCEEFRRKKYSEWRDKYDNDLEEWAKNIRSDFESQITAIKHET